MLWSMYLDSNSYILKTQKQRRRLKVVVCGERRIGDGAGVAPARVEGRSSSLCCRRFCRTVVTSTHLVVFCYLSSTEDPHRYIINIK